MRQGMVMTTGLFTGPGKWKWQRQGDTLRLAAVFRTTAGETIAHDEDTLHAILESAGPARRVPEYQPDEGLEQDLAYVGETLGMRRPHKPFSWPGLQ